MYSDADDVILTATTTDTATGHLAYSTDDGKTWTEGNKSVSTEALKLSNDKDVKIKLKAVSDKAYRAAKADGKDPFADDALKVYTISVERLSADLSDSAEIASISFDKNCTECTPVFKKGARAAAALVSHDADNATVTFVTGTVSYTHLDVYKRQVLRR